MIDTEHLLRDIDAIRQKAPLVHNITNFVVMNNTANALLALGASPVMAHAPEEVAEMAAMASAVVLNMGTLSECWVEAMLLAGQSALEHNVPIVFDPVGLGATSYRNQTARRIFKQFTPSIIRGNASEIMALAAELFDTQQQIKTKGVDSTTASDNAIETAQTLAQQLGTVIAISGAEDFITDGKSVHSLKNGSPMMARVTGMGCTASAITGAFAGINSDMLEGRSTRHGSDGYRWGTSNPPIQRTGKFASQFFRSTVHAHSGVNHQHPETVISHEI